MQTLYIDVYFLINFTVDVLALYFAARTGGFPLSFPRLCLSGAIAALAACGCLFLPEGAGALAALIMIFSAAIVVLLIGRGGRPIRLLRLGGLFLLFETLFGGAVYLLYLFFERTVMPALGEASEGVQNRKILLLAALIMLAFGGIKLVAALLAGHARPHSVGLTVELCGKTLSCDALVDSGNFLRDPADLSPVMLVKAKAAAALLPRGIDFSAPGADLPDPWRRKVRLIPIKRGSETLIRIGFVPDAVYKTGRPDEALSLTLAVDPEEGSYAGYDALVPGAVFDC